MALRHGNAESSPVRTNQSHAVMHIFSECMAMWHGMACDLATKWQRVVEWDFGVIALNKGIEHQTASK